MRVLFLSNTFSGLYNFRRELIESLVQNKHSVILSAPFDEKKFYFDSIPCKVIETPFERKGKNPLKDFKLFLVYCKILKNEEPDIVFTFTIKPNVYGGIVSRLFHVPLVANITGLGTVVENPGPLQSLAIFLYRVGLKKARTVFFQNQSNLEFCLKHRIVAGNSRIIPGSGVNLTWHYPQEYPKNDHCVFIYIGRIMREKGIDFYLDAATIIKDSYPGTRFLVMGKCEEDYLGRLQNLSKAGIIEYIGPQNDVRPFIGMSHCTIHPSYYPEGMSNVLLESCAACRPVITTDRPGCKEVVENGVTGYVTKCKDLADLVSKIEQFISLPYSQKVKMGELARERVELLFDRKLVIDAYLEEVSRTV